MYILYVMCICMSYIWMCISYMYVYMYVYMYDGAFLFCCTRRWIFTFYLALILLW